MPMKKWPSLPGTCRLCHEHVSSLQQHYRSFHQLSCRIDYGDGTVHEVFRDQVAGGFPCMHCSRPFPTPRGLQDHARKSDCSGPKPPSKSKPKPSPKRVRRKASRESDTEGGSPLHLKLKICVPEHMRKDLKRPRLDTDGPDGDQPCEAPEADVVPSGDEQDRGSVHSGTGAELIVIDDNVDITAEMEHGPSASDHQMNEGQIDDADGVTVTDGDEHMSVEEEPVEEPVAEESVEEESVEEQPVAEQPVAEQPVAEQPVAEQPVAEEPVAEEPDVEQPVAEEPDVEQPVAEESDVEQPVAEESDVEEPVARSSSPTSDQLEPATVHPGSQPVADSRIETASAPPLTDSAKATPTTAPPPDPVPADSHESSARERRESPSPLVGEPCGLSPATGAGEDDSPVKPAAAYESPTSPPISKPGSPEPLSTSLPEETLGSSTELLAILRSQSLPAHEETKSQAVSSPPGKYPDASPQSRHDVDDNMDVDLLDLDALELEYPSDEEMDTSLTPEASLSTSNGTLHATDGQGATASEASTPSRPGSAAADPARLCHAPLPPHHPVLEFLDEIDADRPPPAHFARAFVDLGYDTDSLLDMLACAKPECGDWDALQAELRTDKKYDAWWLRVKMALRERAARCLRKSGMFIRSSSA
ncbi:hypothetical protein FOMPIDRAFT_1046935 [Fomitopsis schrenkii]|uniref:C2H2-type domain-containing protein n=1 Tax=Fomitopsis schrenkii TaxID=2126942 RepID=S8EEF1_FOMSC|nr:hypothetical protein FOMPIDRAFT_1046935 [Fomitopsis schrenkii]